MIPGTEAIKLLFEPETDAMRLLIVHNAQKQADAGAHYLNGSDGGLPGLRDGLKGRNIQLINDPDEKVKAIRAAKFNGHCCSGRFKKVNGKGIKKGKTPEAERLEEYYEELRELKAKGTPPSDWKDFSDGLFPRTNVEIGKKSTSYVGEDCSDKMHFDCISFVQWVLTNTLKHNKFSKLFDNQYSYSIVQHEGAKKNDGKFGNVVAPGTHYDPPFPKLKNADILTRIAWYANEEDEATEGYKNKKGNAVDNKYRMGPKHIGFYRLDGSVIEASGASRGVIVSKYNASKWTGMFRLHKRFLKFGE